MTSMKKTILLFLIVLIVVSCQKQTATDNKASDTVIHHYKNSLNYVGTYKGTLPCDDCEGLETAITINENSTYSIATKYLGKGEKVFLKKGTFSWNKGGNVIIFNEEKNTPNKYFVEKNKLTQLDMTGKKTIGDHASDYVLSKQSVSKNEIENAEQTEKTVDLNNRIEVSAKLQKVNPAVGKYTLAETKWKLVWLKKEKVIQKDKKDYFLKLNSKDGRFTAFAGCNSIAGNYAMPSPDTLSFSEVIMTRMACPDMTLEDIFGAMLVQVTHYKLENETLTLFGEGKKVLAKFEAIK